MVYGEFRLCGAPHNRKFFDTGDGVLLRLIGKWLNAGVLEGLALSYPDEGTPQGGVISPLLANIYLHDVLDEWFVRDVFAMQKTAKDRLSRTLRRLREWCRWHRHDPLEAQHRMLVKKLEGHYGYYGITGNFPALAKVFYMAKRIWRQALARRSQQRLPWSKMQRIWERFPLPAPHIVHQHAP